VRISAFPALLFCLFATPFSNAQAPQSPKPSPKALAEARSHADPDTPPASKELPITRVSLYKNGVGFFEHSGRVTGDQTVSIAFTTAQLNDVLQSLTAIDLNGGRISGAGYNSTTPLDQQLKALALGLPEKTTFSGFFTAIRGARVEVRSGANVGSASFTGRLMTEEMHKMEPGKDSAGSSMAEGRFITVVSDSGEVRIFQLTPALQVRLLDTTLHTDVNRYLELLDANRNQGFRRLALTDNGTGTRELQVSYLSEVPIWKSTYRILFTGPTATSGAAQTATQTATLQGWSVVDNTTGSDWINVQLALIAGAPQSFLQPLSVPYYSRRPEIPLPQEAQLTPQIHASGDESRTTQPAAGGVMGGVMGGIGSGSGTGMGVGVGSNYGGAVPKNLRSINGRAQNDSLARLAAPPPPPVPYETAAADSITPDTTTHAFDDYFAYNLTQPITIRRNESALVPILQTKVDAERVTLVTAGGPQPQALRALWITNTSNLTLDRGSFTIVEDGNFDGEGLLDPIHPAERRLLSYAADQAVRVTVDHRNDSRHVQRITIAKGILKQTDASVAEVEYLVHNAAPEPRMVVVEQPRREGWTLDSDPKPIETTPTAYRFRVATQPGESVRLHIGERRISNQSFRLVDNTEDQLTVILRNANAGPAILQQLEPIFQAKRALAALEQQIAARQQAIDDLVKDQDRLRSNLTALKSTPEERTLAKRYTDELNQQEDTLATLHKSIDVLNQQREAARTDLANKIEALTLDQTLS
jgi:hypothetical protein